MDRDLYDRLFELEDEHWWFRGRRAVIRALLSRAEVPASTRVLDAGCGTGRNLIELAALGETAGVDSSPEAVQYCAERGLTGVLQGDLAALPFPDEQFGVVLLADVVEHLDDDTGSLRELRRVAAPGAVLVLTAPAYRSLWSQHDVRHHHRRRYRRPEIEGRAQEAGWEPVFSTYFNSVLLPPIAVMRWLGRRGTPGRSDLERTPAALNGALDLPMRAEAKLISKGLRLPFGLSIGLVCRATSVPGPTKAREALGYHDRPWSQAPPQASLVDEAGVPYRELRKTPEL